MEHQKLLKISYHPSGKKDILEKIIKNVKEQPRFNHIVSLNPENAVIAYHDTEFNNILSQGDIQLVDGIGVRGAATILGLPGVERISGVDCMNFVIKMVNSPGVRILLIGGKPNLANELAVCYQEIWPKMEFLGETGFKNIRKPTEAEKKHIFSIISAYKPHILFAAFGSPWQEKWIWANRELLKGVTCMGVGQGFDIYSGRVKRAPRFIRKIGLEWLYRLVTQPWRWRRQLRLIEYIYLVIKQRIIGLS